MKVLRFTISQRIKEIKPALKINALIQTKWKRNLFFVCNYNFSCSSIRCPSHVCYLFYVRNALFCERLTKESLRLSVNWRKQNHINVYFSRIFTEIIDEFLAFSREIEKPTTWIPICMMNLAITLAPI